MSEIDFENSSSHTAELRAPSNLDFSMTNQNEDQNEMIIIDNNSQGHRQKNYLPELNQSIQHKDSQVSTFQHSHSKQSLNNFQNKKDSSNEAKNKMKLRYK